MITCTEWSFEKDGDMDKRCPKYASDSDIEKTEFVDTYFMKSSW